MEKEITPYSIGLLEGFEIEASDGSIGKCIDFLYDYSAWLVHYIVVNTRNWLLGRKVLISPDSVNEIDAVLRLVSVVLRREQVKNSPTTGKNTKIGTTLS